MLEVLSRWNRWGSARLDPGLPRDLTSEILPFLDTQEVVALTGPRRAGKTTLMFQLMDLLEHRGMPKESVLHVNLEEPALEPLLGLDLLDAAYRTFREEVFPSGRAHVFLDEVQRVPEWERWVRARKETEDVKVFVTGSTSSLVSRELGTLLTGRHVQFTVWPLSFREFLRFRDVELPDRPRLAGTPAPVQHALSEYIRWGGFPEIVLSVGDERKERLLKQYFDDVLFKDVALRHEIRDLPTLRALAVQLLTVTSSLVSYQRLARQLGVSLDRVRAYCGYLQDAFLVRFLPYLSLKVSERRRRPQKIHAVDTGLRNAACLTGSPDRGRLAETAAFGAFLRAGGTDVYYWRGKGEVDLARRTGTRTDVLVQVAHRLDDSPAVLERELAALAEARKTFRRARSILVLDRSPTPTKPAVPKAIDVVPLWRFLAQGPPPP